MNRTTPVWWNLTFISLWINNIDIVYITTVQCCRCYGRLTSALQKSALEIKNFTTNQSLRYLLMSTYWSSLFTFPMSHDCLHFTNFLIWNIITSAAKSKPYNFNLPIGIWLTQFVGMFIYWILFENWTSSLLNVDVNVSLSDSNFVEPTAPLWINALSLSNLRTQHSN